MINCISETGFSWFFVLLHFRNTKCNPLDYIDDNC